jgi:hypothetical protein
MSADQIASFGDWKKFLATPGSPWVSTKAVSSKQTLCGQENLLFV